MSLTTSDEIIDNIPQKELPPGKVFELNKTLLGVFLGGPIITGYIFLRNFSVFNENKKGVYAFVISIIFNILLFWSVFQIPEDINFPNMIIPAIYTGITYFLFKKFLLDRVEKHVQEGGAVYSWGHIIIASLIAMLIYVVTIFGIVYSIESDNGGRITKSYGSQNKCTIEYDPSKLNEATVDKLALSLTKNGIFNTGYEMYISITTDGETIYIPLTFSDPNNLNNENAIDELQLICNDINFSITTHEININILDDEGNIFKTLKP